jgi:2-oxoglutarate-Fe(II)-dependent oxygenase superfamily protein
MRPDDPIRSIERGKIYENVYEKRMLDRHFDEIIDAQAELEVARIEGDSLVFESDGARARAYADGVFFLGIPESLDLSAGDEFSRQFYAGASATPYGRFRDLGPDVFCDPLLGFHQRVDQIEQFLLESRFWQRYFPPEIAAIARELTALSRKIVRSVLEHADIPPECWAQATGGCADGAGSYHLTFNHYRPEMREIGLSSHKDDGFATILRAASRGLQVNRADQWESVSADPGYFVVNFGLSMELLTGDCGAPVSAIMHRVERQSGDRSSFGHFTSSRCEPGDDDGIYRYQPGAGLQRVCGSRELIEANDYEIYEGTDAPEGNAR